MISNHTFQISNSIGNAMSGPDWSWLSFAGPDKRGLRRWHAGHVRGLLIG